MNKKLWLKRFSIAAAMAIFNSQAVLADFPGRHPGYLHALSDLRLARYLVYRPDAPNVASNEFNAVRAIDACINDLKQASINDGKNIYSHPPADLGIDFNGRLHKALDALRSARHDMDKEEDDQYNIGLQARATQHVDQAISYVKHAIGDKEGNFLRHL